jgi:cytochrome P450
MQALDVLGFDPASESFLTWPYPDYERLRNQGPMHQTPAGLWVVTGHAECTQILRDLRFGHNTRVASGLSGGEESRMEGSSRGLSFIFMDPPDHTRLRAVVAKAFTPRSVGELRASVQATADGLIGQMLSGSDPDIMADVARPLPTITMCNLLGIPDADQARIGRWSGVIGRSLDPELLLPAEVVTNFRAAIAEVAEYVRALVRARASERRPDLISHMLAAEEGDRLGRQEIVELCVLLLVAGSETTVNLIGNGMLALLRHPQQITLIRKDPKLIKNAVFELLRYDSPSQMTFRVAMEDAEVAGHAIARGSPVMLVLAAANRDPRVFDHPDVLDVTRQSSMQQLSFSQGLHFCLGAALAQVEAEIALSSLLRHDLRMVADHPPRKPNLVLRGLAELRVAEHNVAVS